MKTRHAIIVLALTIATFLFLFTQCGKRTIHPIIASIPMDGTTSAGWFTTGKRECTLYLVYPHQTSTNNESEWTSLACNLHISVATEDKVLSTSKISNITKVRYNLEHDYFKVLDVSIPKHGKYLLEVTNHKDGKLPPGLLELQGDAPLGMLASKQ